MNIPQMPWWTWAGVAGMNCGVASWNVAQISEVR